MNFNKFMPLIEKELNCMSDDEYKETKSAALKLLNDQDEQRGIKNDDDNNL